MGFGQVGMRGGVDDEGYIGEERESQGDASRRFVWHCLQLKLVKRDVILMNAILMTCCRMTYCKVAFCDSAIPRRRRRRDRGPNVMHLLYHWCFVRTNTLNGNTILIWMSWQEPFSKFYKQFLILKRPILTTCDPKSRKHRYFHLIIWGGTRTGELLLTTTIMKIVIYASLHQVKIIVRALKIKTKIKDKIAKSLSCYVVSRTT